MEDDLTKNEDDQKWRRPKTKTAKNEDDQNEDDQKQNKQAEVWARLIKV